MDYNEMLDSAFENLPESALKSSRFVVPKIRGHIQGNKTILSNFYQVLDLFGRDEEHFLKFILKELATPGEAKKPLVILGRKVSASRINEKISEYATRFVICKECKKPDTVLIRQNRILFIKCNACGAKYPTH